MASSMEQHWKLRPIVEASAPWHQRVSCTCHLTLPPTLLSLWAISFAGPPPLMDQSMGPRWRKMAMRRGGTSGGLMCHRVGVDCTCQAIAAYSTCSLHPWLPLWSYIGSCGLLWGANAPWYQRVSCTCQLTLPPTLLSLWAIAFTRWLPLMDLSMGPRWHEMAMWGQDIWRANALPGWG